MIKKINNVLFILLTIIFGICTVIFSEIGAYEMDGAYEMHFSQFVFWVIPLIFLILICVTIIKRILSKDETINDNKYNYLILINNACMFLWLIIWIKLFKNSRYLMEFSMSYCQESIFILSFLSYIYIVLQGKNRKLHNNLMFLILNFLLLIFLSYEIDFPMNLLLITILPLFIIYIINLIKKNNVLYSNKHNLMLCIYELVVIIMLVYRLCYLMVFDFGINDHMNLIMLSVILILLYFILLQLFKCKKSKLKKILSLIFYHLLIIPFILTALYPTSSLISDAVDDYKDNQRLKKSYTTSKEVIKRQNDYSSKKAVLNYEFNYNLEVNNEKELRNLIYTLINSGQGEITLKCNYDGCLDDETVYSYLNDNLVSVFNQHEEATYWCSTKKYCEIQMNNKYSKEDIKEIKRYVNEIYDTVYDASKQDYDNIKAFHDYLIDNYNYNKATSRTELTALDFLKNKSSSSQGYSEIMSLLLDKMEISNVIIEADYINKENEEMYHPWNLIKLNGKWFHLDVALDDLDNKLLNNTDRYKYFLIDNDTLKSYDDGLHKYDSKTYGLTN